MTRRWVLPIVLLLASVATPADAPAGRIGRTQEFVQRVNAAVDRGVAWLKKTQASDGSFADFPTFPGATTALAYHTLRVCGVARDDRAADRAWQAMRRAYDKEDLLVYSAAIYLMAIAEHGQRTVRPADDHDVKLPAEDWAWASEIARCLASGQRPDGTWNYNVADVRARMNFPPPYYDHSNTQYALLGLKSAARCGIAVDPSVWKRSLAHFLDAQQASGPQVAGGFGDASSTLPGATHAEIAAHARGWGYQSCRAPVTPMYGIAEYSMTAAGVSSVVICRSELLGTSWMTDKRDSESDRSVWDGLAWLGTRGSRSMLRIDSFDGENRRKLLSILDLYEFYGVERAGVLAAVDWMGPLDWYGDGALALLDAQKKDGSWTGRRNGIVLPGEVTSKEAEAVVDTCFALLFLKRGTTPVRRGAVTQLDDTDIRFGEAAKLKDADFEDFVELVLSRWRRAADDGVKTRLFDGAASVGPRIVDPLLHRLDSPDADKRAAAHALLRHATGLDFGYVADAPSDARETALAKWLAWWIGAKDRTAYDPASKRLVVK